MIRRFIDHSWTFAILTCVPMVMIADSWWHGSSYGRLMFETGEWATRFLVLSLAVTPLGVLFGRFGWWRWLRRRRRILGLAALLYTCAHALLYLRETGTVSATLTDLADASIWTGWLALLVMVPLAITSTDSAVRRLGARWFALHRLAYGVAVLAAIHWYLVEQHLRPVAIYFLPIALLEFLRFRRSRRSAR